jgi:hypothetical protein
MVSFITLEHIMPRQRKYVFLTALQTLSGFAAVAPEATKIAEKL